VVLIETAKREIDFGAANFSASGLKREDNDLIVIEGAEAASGFKRQPLD
jgi:hypothetical protein